MNLSLLARFRMLSGYGSWLLAGVIVLAIILGGCRGSNPPGPTSVAQVTATELVTTLTPLPTTSSTATATSTSATLEPAVPMTASPTPTEAPAATLPASPTAVPTPPPLTATPLPTTPATPSPTSIPVAELAADTPLEGQALVAVLQQGGYVIYFRHAATDWSQADQPQEEQAWWTHCDPQRMRQLAEAGQTQARAIGEALRALQIPVGQILASPYCRTVETAELLAMGPVTATTDLLNMYAADYVGGRAQVIATTRRLLSTPPQPETNTVLVSHGNVLHGATNISLAEGEAAIFAPAGADSFTLVARVLAKAWPALLPAGPAKTGQVATAEASPLPATATLEICEPTPPDGLGPFYVPNAPARSSVGQGHLLSGVVRSSLDCAPIPSAQIEFWLAGPDGQYGDAYRASVFANNLGAYRFESHFPPAYSGRPAHIHLRISANGYQTLVTQYYPAEGQADGSFDLVLLPNN